MQTMPRPARLLGLGRGDAAAFRRIALSIGGHICAAGGAPTFQFSNSPERAHALTDTSRVKLLLCRNKSGK